MPRKTIKDIASESGYSTGTVSRVLNDSGPVSEAARKKIMGIVEKYNFQLNTNAKFLKQRQPEGIALVIRGRQNLLFSSLVELLQQKIEKAGYSANVYYLDEEDDEVKEAIDICHRRCPEGFLFLGSSRSHFMKSFAQIRIPSVLVTNSAEGFGFDNLGSVSTNDAVAAQVAVDKLIRMGHKNIGILGGDLATSQAALARFQGAQYAFYDHNIVFHPDEQYYPGVFSVEDGYIGMDWLLDHCPDITAVFAMADVMAIGALRSLHDRNLRVPEDVALISFDGLMLSQYTYPRLATIYQNGPSMVEQSLNMLFGMIEEGKEPQYLESPFFLVEGETLTPANNR